MAVAMCVSRIVFRFVLGVARGQRDMRWAWVFVCFMFCFLFGWSRRPEPTGPGRPVARIRPVDHKAGRRDGRPAGRTGKGPENLWADGKRPLRLVRYTF